LKLYGAIVLIPKHPLIVGHRYRVDIKTQRHVLSWDFAVVSPSRPDATL
jgi:hypothetical protein